MTDSERNEDDVLIEECTICGGDILVDGSAEEEDIVYCNDCEAEYLIYSLDPLRLRLLDDDLNHDMDGADDNFDEEYE